MSSRRSSRGNISDEEINELISKLQALLPASSRRRGSGQVHTYSPAAETVTRVTRAFYLLLVSKQ
jgi:hypothetical protein